MEELVCLLGLPADAAQITSCVASLSGKEAESNAQVKSYPGIEYHNYRKLGLSLQFEPSKEDGMTLAAVDVYSGQRGAGWSSFPRLPFDFSKLSNGRVASISAESVGKEFVMGLGEPTRKGGGEAGGGGLGPGLWMEWQHLTMLHADPTPPPFSLLVELAPDDTKAALKGGGHRWDLDKAGSSPWHTLTFHRTV